MTHWLLVLGLCLVVFAVCVAVGGTSAASVATAAIIACGVLAGELSRLLVRSKRTT